MKKLFQVFIGVCLASTLLFFLFPEHGAKQPAQFTGLAMGIPYKVLIGNAPHLHARGAIEKMIAETFAEIDQTYNKWNPFSEVSELNRLGQREKKQLSGALHRFLIRMDHLVALSEGRFDPTVENAQRFWKTKFEQGTVPSKEEIAALKRAVGWKKIHFDQEFFYKDDADIQLDFGGVAKGTAVDLLYEKFLEAGLTNFFIEWGGEVRVLGYHPEKRPWNVYISRFEDSQPDQAIALLSLSHGAVATSGNYFQYWTVIDPAGIPMTYTHIFNPCTCEPIQVHSDVIASGSLWMEDCETADALAKVLLTFDSIAEAEEWLKKVAEVYPNISYWIAKRGT